MRRKKLWKQKKYAAVHDQEEKVVGNKKHLIGNSEPPGQSVLVLSTEITGNDDEKVSFCVIKGKKYEYFDNHAFFCDTSTSHIMDTDVDGLYNAVPIQDRIGEYVFISSDRNDTYDTHNVTCHCIPVMF